MQHLVFAFNVLYHNVVHVKRFGLHLQYPLPCTVRADITDLRADPDSPIKDTDTGCLSADSTAMIICDNIAFPVATTVEFLKDGVVIDADAEDR